LDEFRDLAKVATDAGTSEAAERALARYAGRLLPEDVYEPWAEEARESVRLLHLDLLRRAARWEEVLEEDPTDEAAHLALIRQSADRGDVRGALRQFERLDHALLRELGTTPSPEAERLRARLNAGAGRAEHPAQGVRLVGRRDVGDQIRAGLSRADSGRGSTLLLSGPPGVGKTAVLGLAEALVRQRDWRTGRGTASAVEGPWPYASVLEAFGDLCRQHPALLDGLDDLYRLEIERALSGRDVSWSGESSHQRLFVAVAELMRLAASGHGLLLVIDDLQDADEASLRLLHFLSRCAVTEPVLIAVAHRPQVPDTAYEVAESLVPRGAGRRVELGPLDQGAIRRLLADGYPALRPETVEQIYEASGGLPFAALELGANPVSGVGPMLPVLPVGAVDTFQRAALLGTTFTTDELLALSGADEDATYVQLEAGFSARMVEPAEAGYRFRHALVRERLVDMVPQHKRAGMRREVAERIAELGGPPARMAHLFVAAGLTSRAVPYVLRAVETAGALGAYRDGLTMIDAVLEHAEAGDRPRLLARRGDLLNALGDPGAVAAYQDAVAVTTGTEHRLVRARLARAAVFAGEPDVARESLAGLEVEGDAADGPILAARGNQAYFAGDLDTAWEIANQGGAFLSSTDDPWQFGDLISLQGLAQSRGEWFERFRMELRRTRGKQRLATALFDAHLCVAEYLLYGPVPYREVIEESEELLRHSDRIGALRGAAFAHALIGEAALLMGDLERAERELVEAVDLHRDVDARRGRRTACSGSPRCGSSRATRGRHGGCWTGRCRWPAGR